MHAGSTHRRERTGPWAGVSLWCASAACGSAPAGDDGSTGALASSTAMDDASEHGTSTAADLDTSTSAGTSTDAVTSDATTAVDSSTDPSGETGDDALAGCFHSWTFDDCDETWEVGAADASAPTPPGWECGEPPDDISLGGAHTGVWATSLSGEYTEDQSSYLASPSFSLADCTGATVYLSFAHLYQFGSGDGGVVQARVMPTISIS